jgi:hypothetical protein
MAKRRPLTQALKGPAASNRAKEDDFVYGTENKPAVTEPQAPAMSEPPAADSELPASSPRRQPSAVSVKLSPSIGRVSFSTKMRADISQALKRASLDRQLQGLEPNTVQEILEEALEPWLYKHGYLS